MPLNSVSQYLAGADGLLASLPVPAVPGGQAQTLTSFITPPTPGKLSGPLSFLGDVDLLASRESMPRGAGFKNLIWTVNIYLAYGSSGKSPVIDQQFPLIADAVMMRLWSTGMPATIYDPTTGFKSRIMSVGEAYRFQKPRVRTVGAQQMLYYAARFAFEIKELVKA